MLNHIPLSKILFLDIETVPEVEKFEHLPPKVQSLWEKKSRYQRQEDISAEDFYERAGIWAEFGKVVCLSVGYFLIHPQREFRVTSFTGSEPELLTAFNNLITQHFDKKDQLLCAHNGKEFDFPFLARRMLIHGIALPDKLNLFGKKPWEVPHLDTLELWKFGDYKHYTSLNLLTHVLGIPSPKSDISGDEVARVFYEEQNIARIKNYCERDVVAIAQIILKFKGESLLDPEEIKSV